MNKLNTIDCILYIATSWLDVKSWLHISQRLDIPIIMLQDLVYITWVQVSLQLVMVSLQLVHVSLFLITYSWSRSVCS